MLQLANNGLLMVLTQLLRCCPKPCLWLLLLSVVEQTELLQKYRISVEAVERAALESSPGKLAATSGAQERGKAITLSCGCLHMGTSCSMHMVLHWHL